MTRTAAVRSTATGDRSRLAVDPQEAIEQELLEVFANQGMRVPAAVIVSALLIVAMCWQKAPLALSVGWLLAVVIVLCLRGFIHMRLPRAHSVPLRRRMVIAAAISAVGGVTHGASILFWPYMSDLERAVQSSYVMALGSGAVAALVGYMPAYLAYILPLLLPMVSQWVLLLSDQTADWHGGSAPVMLLLFAVYVSLLVVLARDTFRHYRASFDSRRELRAALSNAEAANRAKTRFLASASHDLRQPMHTLTLFGAALAMVQLDDRARHIATQMNRALQALGSQLDTLLDVSKLDAGVVNVKFEDVALTTLVRRVAAEFEPLARHKGLELRCEVEPLACVRSDELLLERVLRNLVDNAVKYTERGEVSIRVTAEADKWLVVVGDTGIGIAESEQERIFEEFYQVGNPERDRSQGLGLGLSIVRRLADLMDLQMLFDSRPGDGTDVLLRLPRVTSRPPDSVPVTAPGAVAGMQVLVIDDEDSVRQGMQTVLEGLGCLVHATGSAAAACDALRGQHFDVVLADLRLRGVETGIDAIVKLREIRAGQPAVLISGDTAPQRLREARAAGLTMLHKPVSLHALVQAMRAAVARL